MQYLRRAFDLADARGYLRCPEVLALRDRVPGWFHRLGTDAGAAEFEARCGFRVPAAVREFYASPPLGCFLEATIDGEVFLTDLATMTGDDMPPVVEWPAGPHLVIAFHNHSGMVFAAGLGADDPLAFWGFDEDPDEVADPNRPPVSFSQWVFDAVDGHEARLDHWQRLYEKCKADPAESARLGGLEWVRAMPGMARRLGPAD